MSRTPRTIRPTASEQALGAVGDLIAELLAANGKPGFDGLVRERLLQAYLRGQRSVGAIEFEEMPTPVVDVWTKNAVDMSHADTNPRIRRSRVSKRPKPR